MCGCSVHVGCVFGVNLRQLPSALLCVSDYVSRKFAWSEIEGYCRRLHMCVRDLLYK